MAFEYSNFFNNVAVQPGAPTTVPHTLGTADFVAFLVQDVTDSGTPLIAGARAWVQNKTSASFQIMQQDAAPEYYSVFITRPHSILDPGPIVPVDPGNPSQSVRTAALTQRGGIPSYRSCHHLQFGPALGGEPFIEVTVVHNLGFSDIAQSGLGPIQATSDPGAAPATTRLYVSGVTASTITYRAEHADLSPFGPNEVITADMFVNFSTCHSFVWHDNASLARLPSYLTGSGIPLLSAPNPSPFQHNLNGEAVFAIPLVIGVNTGTDIVGVLTRRPLGQENTHVNFGTTSLAVPPGAFIGCGALRKYSMFCGG